MLDPKRLFLLTFCCSAAVSEIHADAVVLDPDQRSYHIDFTDPGLFASGEANNTIVREGALELVQVGGGHYANEGEWISPPLDSGHAHIFWEWLSATADHAGQEENLVFNGDFEAIDRGSPDQPSGWFFHGATPPVSRIDEARSSSGLSSMRLTSLDQPPRTSWAYVVQHAPYMFPIDESRPLHVRFDLSQQTDDKELEFGVWIDQQVNDPEHGVVVKSGPRRLARYSFHLPSFEEQSFTVHFNRFLKLPGHIAFTGARIAFWYDWRNNDRATVSWVDNVKAWYDQPLSFETRTSADGSSWSDWSEPRFFVRQHTSPGAMPERFIQIKLRLRTGDDTRTPSLRDLVLEYALAFPFAVPWDRAPDSPLDPPAQDIGALGFITVTDDGHFQFENADRPHRFWATQIGDVASYAENRPGAELLCRRLRQLGFNLLKLTPIFKNSYSDEFHGGFLNVLQACREEGIHVALQLNGDTRDTRIVPGGYPDLERHIRRVMVDSPNLDGIKLWQDPQIAIVQLFNEEGIFTWWALDIAERLVGDAIRPKIDEEWLIWLTDHYGDIDGLLAVWGGEQALTEQEQLLLPGLTLADIAWRIWGPMGTGPYYWYTLPDVRFAATTRFFGDLFRDFYSHFMAYVRAPYQEPPLPPEPVPTIRAAVVGNCEYYGMAGLKARQAVEVLDTHPYYDFREVPDPYAYRGAWQLQFPQSRTPHRNMIFEESMVKLAGKPLIASESNYWTGNRFAAELPLYAASYFGLQDWDDWTLFLHTTDRTPWSEPNVPYGHITAYDPVRMLQMPAASRIFRQQLVQPAQQVIEIEHTDDFIHDFKHHRYWHSWNVPLLDNPYVFMHRIQRGDLDAVVDRPFTDYTAGLGPAVPPYISDTGELTLDPEAGYFVLDAPAARAVVGRVPDQPAVLGDVTLAPWPSANNFAALSLVSLDQRPLAASSQILLTAAGRCEGQGRRWNSEKSDLIFESGYTTLTHQGVPPVLVEGINADVTLGFAFAGLELHRLDPAGVPDEIPLVAAGAGEGYTLIIRDSDKTLWYLLTVTPLAGPDGGIGDAAAPDSGPEDTVVDVDGGQAGEDRPDATTSADTGEGSDRATTAEAGLVDAGKMDAGEKSDRAAAGEVGTSTGDVGDPTVGQGCGCAGSTSTPAAIGGWWLLAMSLLLRHLRSDRKPASRPPGQIDR